VQLTLAVYLWACCPNLGQGAHFYLALPILTLLFGNSSERPASRFAVKGGLLAVLFNPFNCG